MPNCSQFLCADYMRLKLLHQRNGSHDKKTFYRPEDYPVLQGEMQPDLSNYLFFVEIFLISLRLKQWDKETVADFCICLCRQM